MTSGSKPTAFSFPGPCQKARHMTRPSSVLRCMWRTTRWTIAQFEGIIPGGNYGAGSVIVWDEGTYHNLTARGGIPVPVREAVDSGHVSVWLEGSKLIGGWSLTRFGPEDKSWTLVKRNDERADPAKDITTEAPRSVKSRRTINDVMLEAAAAAAAAAERDGRGAARSRGTRARPSGSGSGLTPAKFFPPMLAQALQSGSSRAATARCLAGVPSGCSSQNWTVYAVSLCAMATTSNCGRATGSRSIRVFAAIVNALKAVPAENLVLDGEVVGIVGGLPDFGALQQGTAADVEYQVFDLPWLLGQDLRHLPIEDRKALLAKTIEDNPSIKVVQGLEGDPQGLFEAACAEGWEGLMAKRRGSTYIEGRSADWRKLKCTMPPGDGDRRLHRAERGEERLRRSPPRLLGGG